MKIDEFERQLMKDPFNVELRLRYARALHDADRIPDALEQAKLVSKQDATSSEALLFLIECYYDLDDDASARATYAKWDNQTAGSQRPTNQWDDLYGTRQRLRIADERAQAPAHVDTGVSFADVVGMAELKEQLRLKIIMPFQKPEIFAKFKKDAGGGVLLYGPPGCGKTMIAKAIATECKANFISVGISDVLSKWIGESEGAIKSYFQRARANRPCVLFFDELDALAGARGRVSSDHLRSMVNEFLQQLDGFSADNENILLLAATNMPWDVDPAMKRTGRFSRHFFLPPPDRVARTLMLEAKMQGIPSDEIVFDKVAEKTERYSGADLDGIIDYAKEQALTRTFASGKEDRITEKDLIEGVRRVPPTTNEWITTVSNLIKYGGSDPAYADVEDWLRRLKLI